MSPNKRKTIQMEYDEDADFKHRRTSLAVNLSYANLTDSGHGSLRKTQIKNSVLSPNQIQPCNELSNEQDEMQYFHKSSFTENTVHNAKSLISCKEDKILKNVSVRIVDIRHMKKTDTKFEELKNAILNKTKEIFSQQDECAIKTSLILENQNNSINKVGPNQQIIDKVTSNQAISISSEKNTDCDKLSIFSTPTNKSPKLKKFLNSSKITKRKLFKDTNVETVTGKNSNLENDMPLSSTIYTNCNSSPIITSSNRKHRISKLALKNISKIGTKSNTQEDQENVSSLSSLMDVSKSIGTPMFCSTFNEKFNRENNPFNGINNINNQNFEHKNTNAVTMELTSCIAENNVIGINGSSEVKSRERSKIQETGETNSSSQCEIDKKEILSESGKNEKSVDHDELSLNVNTSIDNEMEDKNNSEKITPKDIEQESITIARSSLQVNTSLNSTYKHRHDKKQQTKKQNTRSLENNDLTSHIECTPYQFPDKIQSKSQLNSNTIKNSTKSNPSKSTEILNMNNTQEKDRGIINLRNKSCLHEVGKEKNILHKTVILGDSPIVSLDKEKCKEVIINDSLSEPESSKDKTENNILEIRNVIPKVTKKKKLLTLCEDTQLSFSPKELSLSSRKQTAIMKKGKKTKKKIRRNKFLQHFSQTQAQPTTSSLDKHNSDSTENDLIINPKKKKECKKYRNIVSKKFIIKRRADDDILKQLENLHTYSDEETEFGENRNSLNEFQTRKKDTRLLLHKSQKINMVVTGFSKEDKNLIKNIVKTLGMAHIESNVTRRTTHVVSTGVRTLNLLHGIIRGCWLVTLEWVLKSLENNGWLNPEQYEMPHFSKAVQENRKDRELFGMAFVPELFATCGLLHIENGTVPPSHALKELVKTAGGRITENPQAAKINIGTNGIKESWILDSITTGNLQPVALYQRK